MRSRSAPPRPLRGRSRERRPQSGAPRGRGTSPIPGAGTYGSIPWTEAPPRPGRLAPSKWPSRSPLNRAVLGTRETPGSAGSHEGVGRAERANGNRLSLVRRLALLRAQQDRRIRVSSKDRVALLHALIPEVARSVPTEPGLLVEDEPARSDADEVRGEDAVQGRHVAPQLGLAPFFRPLQHLRLAPRSGLNPGRPARCGQRRFPIRWSCVVHGSLQSCGGSSGVRTNDFKYRPLYKSSRVRGRREGLSDSFSSPARSLRLERAAGPRPRPLRELGQTSDRESRERRSAPFDLTSSDSPGLSTALADICLQGRDPAGGSDPGRPSDGPGRLGRRRPRPFLPRPRLCRIAGRGGARGLGEGPGGTGLCRLPAVLTRLSDGGYALVPGFAGPPRPDSTATSLAPGDRDPHGALAQDRAPTSGRDVRERTVPALPRHPRGPVPRTRALQRLRPRPQGPFERPRHSVRPSPVSPRHHEDESPWRVAHLLGRVDGGGLRGRGPSAERAGRRTRGRRHATPSRLRGTAWRAGSATT